MWRKLKNRLFSFSSYADLSPDLRIKRRVSRFLRQRSALSADVWYTTYWQELSVSPQVAKFVYVRLSNYSDLEFARVRPTDRLNDDLHLPLVCWFDWELSLCDDFWADFGIDMCGCFNPDALETVRDLVMFLNQQAISVRS